MLRLSLIYFGVEIKTCFINLTILEAQALAVLPGEEVINYFLSLSKR
jgi:hypothetical protein